MKVALVHDWLTGMRGGEKVLEVLCEIFPEADLFTLLHVPGTVSDTIEKRRIKTSFIQGLPMARTNYRNYLPLFPLALRSFDLEGYGLVVSSSHCVAKGVRTPPGSVHVSYIHTPMRYVWDRFDDYFGKGRTGHIRGGIIKAVSHYMRKWDASSNPGVDEFIANSNYVAGRIRKYWGRESTVIHPPVDCGRFRVSEKGPEDYYLVVSALAPYKRIDTAIGAFNRTGKRLVVIGTGPEEARLRAMAGRSIEFLGWVSSEELSRWYSGCRALILPGEEDFGITPLEAMASGRPVVALARGGSLETVRPLGEDSPTGIFFNEDSPEAVMSAVKDLEMNMESFDPKTMREWALTFDRPLFKERLSAHILKKYVEVKRL